MPLALPTVWLIRHGETDWSRTGRHTGRTDLPLDPDGRDQAARVGTALAGIDFSLVLASPLRRAVQTCEISGWGGAAESCPEVMEWDYGEYEGLTTAEIRVRQPGWNMWTDGCPGGEDAAEVGRRLTPTVARLRAASGNVAVFAHGHVLRVLAAGWLGLEPDAGRIFALATASVSVLGVENARPVVVRWNDTHHLDGIS